MVTATTLLQLLLFSAAMGSFGLHAKKILPWPNTVRFLAGVATTPFALSAVVYVIGLLWPGAPAPLFTWVPVVLAAVILVWKGIPAIAAAWREYKGKEKPEKEKPSKGKILCAVIICGSCFLVFLLAASRLYISASQPIIDHDIAHYITEARYFAENPRSLEINSGTGEQLGTVHPDDHGPFYVAYYAHAVFRLPVGAVPSTGFIIFNIYSIFTFACMLAAFCALAIAVHRGLFFTAFSVVALFQIQRLYYITDAHSRDAYYLTGVALFILVLFALAKNIPQLEGKERKLYIPGLLYIFWASLCLLQGHGWGLLVFGCGLLTLFVFFTGYKVAIKRQLSIYAAMCLGAGTGLLHMALRFLRTGKLRSYVVDYAPNSPLSQRYIEQADTATGILTKFGDFFFGAQGTLLFISLAGCIWVLARWVMRKRGRKLLTEMPSYQNLFLSLFFILLSLPVFGVFGRGVFNTLSNNFRYSFYLYFMAAIVCSAFMFEFSKLLASGKKQMLAVRTVLTVLMSAAAFLIIYTNWPASPVPVKNYANGFYNSAALAQEKADGGRIMTDIPAMSIYFEDPPLNLLSAASTELISAKNEDAVKKSFEELGVQVFVSQEGNAPGFDETEIYFYLEANASKKVIEEGRQTYTIYYGFS